MSYLCRRIFAIKRLCFLVQGLRLMSNVSVENLSVDTCVTDAGTRSFALSWYPMYVSYSQELKVKEALEKEGVKCFLPMVHRTARVGKKIVHTEEPAIHNLIFVYSNRKQLRELKMFNRDCTYMQFISIRPRHDDQSSVVITVPEYQMNQFMRAMGVDDVNGQRTYLSYSDYLGREGQRVRFIRGTFAGIEGTIKRIKNNRQLVIALPHVGALAISIPSVADLELIEEETETNTNVK